MDPVVVDGYSLHLPAVQSVAHGEARVELTAETQTRDRLEASWQMNQRLTASGKPVYGVTTGPGNAVDTQIGQDRVRLLQANMVKFLGCGLGDSLPVEECRAAVLARLNCLARGYSGVRPALIHRLAELLNLDIVPCIPAIGSVGASGDLIPSSYIAAVLQGRRTVYHQGGIRVTSEVYEEVGITPLTLEAKEGLALVNGTTVMTAITALATESAHRLGVVADACTALAVDVLGAMTGPFDAFLHDVAKPHPGQIASASRVRRLLAGGSMARQYDEVVAGLGSLKEGRRSLPTRIQDSYSIRCAPQCVGALFDAITWARTTLEVELNSSNDNPLFVSEPERVHSGGNFSGFHVGLVADTLKVAVASVADMMDRQFAVVVDEKYNRGLGVACRHPLPDDHPESGTHHGFKGMQLAMSALAAEALNASLPMTVFSRSTASHNQDKVSMATIAARQAREVVDLAEKAASVYLLLLAQAADLRGPDGLGHGARRVFDAIRSVASYASEDREFEADIQEVNALVESGTLAAVVDDPHQMGPG